MPANEDKAYGWLQVIAASTPDQKCQDLQQ